MVKRKAVFFALGVLCVVFGLFFGCSRFADRKPNIILISIDTLRADRLGVYGYKENITPNIDLLASKGIVFRNAVTPMSTTFPAHATMLTGLYPLYHGLRQNGDRLPDKVRMVSEEMLELGYDTASFVSSPQMHFLGGLNRGFSVANGEGRTKKTIIAGMQTLAMAQDWIRGRKKTQPFFLWFHLFEPHSPYVPSDYSERLFKEKKYDGPFVKGISFFENFIETKTLILSSNENIQAMNILYDGEIQKADDVVGRLISTLSDEKLLDNTVVFLVADHGQGLGEYKRIGHGAILWEGALHIPFIIRDYRNDMLKPININERVGLIDLAPTISELAGGKKFEDKQGQSLAPIIVDPHKRPSPMYYYAEAGVCKNCDLQSTAIYYGNKKIEYEYGKYQLFDLDEDRDGVHPISLEQLDDKMKTTALPMTSAIEMFLKNNPQITPQNNLTPKDIEGLRSLGYIR